jgi:transposase
VQVNANTAIKKGNTYLRVAIVGAAWAAVRMKDSYWHALFDKLRKRMKAQKSHYRCRKEIT